MRFDFKAQHSTGAGLSEIFQHPIRDATPRIEALLRLYKAPDRRIPVDAAHEDEVTAPLLLTLHQHFQGLGREGHNVLPPGLVLAERPGRGVKVDFVPTCLRDFPHPLTCEKVQPDALPPRIAEVAGPALGESVFRAPPNGG